MSNMGNENYSTSDLGIAAVLLTLNYQLQELDKSNPKRIIFRFVTEQEIEQVEDDYKDRKLRIEPMQLLSNVRYLKNRIYDEK